MITAREFFELHSILTAIVEKELERPAPVPEAVKQVLVQGAADRPVPDDVLPWVALLDLAVNPHLLRRQMKQNGADEATIRALLRFLVGKTSHSQSDRDKVDWLATFFFQAREERTKQPTGWPKNMVQEILSGFQFPAISGEAEELLSEVSSLLEEIRYFEKFVQITDSRIIQRGRDLKNRFGDEFFHPDVLAATINYNLVFGKKFHALLQETMQKVRVFASQIESGPRDEKELLHEDYRSTGDALQHLGELGRKHASEKAASRQPGAASASPAVRRAPERSPSGGGVESEEKLKDLGIDVEAEKLAVKKRIEELAVRIKANPAMNLVPCALGPVALSEWELNAFRTGYPESEQSFRAEFTRALTKAIAIVSLIHDELPAYDEKKATEYLWKKHYDTLLYLLQEGRCHKENVTNLSAATEKKGLIDKAKQLLQTAQKLEAALGKLAGIFQE